VGWPIPTLSPVATPRPPRLWRWFALLLLFVAIGGAAIVWLWPADRPASGMRFWLACLGLPLFSWLAMFSMRLLAYGNANALATMQTEARTHLLAQWREWGDQRLAVLQVELLGPESRRYISWNVVEAMFGDAAEPEPQPGNCRQMREVNPDDALSARQTAMLGWLLIEAGESTKFVTEGGGAVEVVALGLTGSTTTDHAREVADLLNTFSLDVVRAHAPEHAVEAKVSALFGHWSTGAGKRCGLVAITQLWDETGDCHASEGGVAIVLAPESMARAANVKPVAWLRRPMQSDMESLEHNLQTMLDAQGPPPPDAHWWLNGMDADSTCRLLSHSRVRQQAGPASAGAGNATMLDMYIGPPGALCEWQALAAACIAARVQGTVQYFAARNQDGIVTARIDPFAPNPESP